MVVDLQSLQSEKVVETIIFSLDFFFVDEPSIRFFFLSFFDSRFLALSRQQSPAL